MTTYMRQGSTVNEREAKMNYVDYTTDRKHDNTPKASIIPLIIFTAMACWALGLIVWVILKTQAGVGL